MSKQPFKKKKKKKKKKPQTNKPHPTKKRNKTKNKIGRCKFYENDRKIYSKFDERNIYYFLFF